MDENIQHFLDQEAHDKRPLIISGCLHGVTESWGFKNYLLENIRWANSFNIIARWVQPDHEPKMEDSTKRVISVELKVEEISRAVLILIHHTKFWHYRNRFGSDMLDLMKKEWYLEVREDPRFWHIKKSADERKEKYEKLLAESRGKSPLWRIHPKIIAILEKNDANYQKTRDKHKQDWKKKRRS